VRAQPLDLGCVTVDIVVNARHAEVSPTLREATRKKVAHLERFATDARLVEVEFSDMASRRTVDAHTCEILVHLKGRLVKGVASAAEQPAALDLAIEKVTHQMRRLHERRLVGRHGGPHRAERLAGTGTGTGTGPVAQAVLGDDEAADLAFDVDEDAESDAGLEIVRTKRFATKPMDIEEAALQMELLGHDFFLFTSSESGRASVMYRRRDGRLGLIEATG
jgi:putative sigma-54 modulation protein